MKKAYISFKGNLKAEEYLKSIISKIENHFDIKIDYKFNSLNSDINIYLNDVGCIDIDVSLDSIQKLYRKVQDKFLQYIEDNDFVFNKAFMLKYYYFDVHTANWNGRYLGVLFDIALSKILEEVYK